MKKCHLMTSLSFPNFPQGCWDGNHQFFSFLSSPPRIKKHCSDAASARNLGRLLPARIFLFRCSCSELEMLDLFISISTNVTPSWVVKKVGVRGDSSSYPPNQKWSEMRLVAGRETNLSLLIVLDLLPNPLL